jgi:hypothetical protein
MTRGELSNLLGIPLESSASDLLKARAARLAELREALQQDGLPKPVKIMLGRELRDLESADAASLVAQLEQIGRAEMLLVGIDDEMAKSGWTRGVVELLCRKLEPLVPGIPEENERLKFEKRLIEITEKLKAARPLPPPPPPAEPKAMAATESTPPLAHDVPARLESYFSEIAAERAKPIPSRGVVRLWLQKIGALIEQLPDDSAHLAFEKRVVEIEYWLDGSQPPWDARKLERGEPASEPKPGEKSKAPQKPLPGTLLQLLPKSAEGTLRRTGVPIHFVARPRFILGRQRSKSDFVAWFLPATPANQQKTDSISRVNTTLLAKGGQLWIHDGEALPDGKIKASVGTVVDGQALTTAPQLLSFAKERNLKLGQSGYELKAIHLPAVAPEGPLSSATAPDNTSSSQATVRLSPGPFGCLRFQPVSCREVEALAVWIFSEASLGADPTCAVILDGAGLPPVALRIHHWNQGFWLVVPGSGRSKVTLDGQPLSGGEVRALQATHQLDLGTLHYDLKVSP